MAFGVLFMQAGLTEDIVQKISDEKDDPVWMREFRMKSLQIYRQRPSPDWGAPIDGLDCISFGPNLLNVHTPNERADIASVARVWEYLKAILAYKE